jgi:levanase
VWECPNLFPLKVKGTNETKWVLVVGINPGSIAGGSGDQYFIGSFDGTTFTSNDPATYTPPAGTTYAGFDTSSYDPWTATGTAFGSGPATSPLPGQSAVDGVVGTGFVDSFNGGDAGTGILSSPTFTVTSPYLNFKIGGGNHPHIVNSVVGTSPPAGTTFADFEGPTYGTGWTETGDLVGTAPAAGTIGDQQPVTGYLGAQLVNTFIDHDATTGTITSPAFTISSDYIDLLVGGGFHPYTGASYAAGAGPTAVNLIVDGKVVETATGANNEMLNWQSWNVTARRGVTAQIQIIDENTGGFGHINVDNIVFATAAAQPINTETAVDLLVDGTVVASATGSDNEALDWASFDLRKYVGKTAQIQIMDENTGGWGHINADQFVFANAPAQSSTQRAHWVDWGADFYAATSFTDLPHGRQILIGWMNNWNYAGNIPTSPWRSATSIPRELGLQRINGRIQLTQQPVAQVASLHLGRSMTARNLAITGTVPLGTRGSTLDLEGVFAAGTAKQFGVNVHTGNGQRTTIGYDTTTQTVFIDRTKSGDVAFDPTFGGRQSAPLKLVHGTVRLRVLVDTSSVEVFTDQGQVVLTDQIFPGPTSSGVSLFSTGGTAHLQTGVAWKVRSIWP